MADIKQIELAIKGIDLASQPLSVIGDAVAKLATAVGEIVPASEKGEKNLNELKDAAAQLKEALKGLSADQNIINQFVLLRDEVAATGTKLATLTAGADAAKAAFEGTGLSAAKLRAAQGGIDKAISSTQTSLDGQNKRLEKLKLLATESGIDVLKLAESEALLDNTFAVTNTQLTRVNAAIGTYAANQKKAALETKAAAEAQAKDAAAKQYWIDLEHRATAALKANAEAAGHTKAKHKELREEFSLFRDEGRTTLSMYQRLRGELLSMAAEFIGFYGVIEQVKKGFEDIEHLEGTKSILTSAFGGEAAAADQLKYVAEQADRLGLKYVDLAQNYAKFSAAALGNGVSKDDAKAVFETFAEAARVKQISAEGITSIFGALEKVMAKDTVGAGELFKKLTTELPDAAAAFRKSFGDGSLSTEQFDKIIKAGKLTSDNLIEFAKTYRETIAEQVPAATKTATAGLERFSNAVVAMRLQIMEGGALEGFSAALERVTEYLKSDAGKTFTEDLATGLKWVADGFVLVATHLEGFKNAFIAFALLWTIHMGRGFRKDIEILGTAITWLSGLFPELGVAVKLFTVETDVAAASATTLAERIGLVAGAMLGAVAALYAGFAVGTWLNDNFVFVREFGVDMVNVFTSSFLAIEDAGILALTAIFAPWRYAAVWKELSDEWQRRQVDFADQRGNAGQSDAQWDQVAEDKKKADEMAAKDAAAKNFGMADHEDWEGNTTTPEQEKASEDAAAQAQKVKDNKIIMDLIDTEAKGVRDHISGLQSSLLKKTADEMKQFAMGLAEQMKPAEEAINKIEREWPKQAAGVVAKMRADLAAWKADSEKAQANVFMEHNAKRQDDDLKGVISTRNADVAAQKELQTYGQSRELTERNIAGITAQANAQARLMLAALQEYIKNAPKAVQESLHAMSVQLEVVSHQLKDVPDIDPIKEMTKVAERMNEQLGMRAAKLEHIKDLEKIGERTAAEALADEKAVVKEYEGVLSAAKQYVDFLLTSDNLTKDQREQLEKIALQLEKNRTGAKGVADSLYTAKQANLDMSKGLTGVGEAFAKAVGQGHSLKDAFHAAGDAFKKFAADFLLQIARMILQQAILKALGGASGGGAGGVVSGAVSAIQALHSGGMAGTGTPRLAMDQWFRNAPRYHAGAIAGLDQNEIPAILQRGEEVLAKNDARNKMNGGGGSSPQHIQVINGIDHESIVRQGLAAPSNTKVILNLIRANKGAVRTALA